jgi:hypothetical protein
MSPLGGQWCPSVWPYGAAPKDGFQMSGGGLG